MAFMDINPVTLGDALIVSRLHSTDLLDIRATAWQAVFHFHLHLIPRFKDQPGRDALGLPWEPMPGDLDEIERVGHQLS